MFFTFTFGSGASSAAAAEGAAEALGATAGISVIADAEGAGGTTGDPDGTNAEFCIATTAALCAAGAVDAAVPAFDAAAEPSGAEAPEHALSPNVVAKTAKPRNNIVTISVLRFILVFPNSSASREVFSRLRCAVRMFR